MSLFGQLFGQKRKTPKELQQEWKTASRAEARKLDRQIRNINIAQKKAEQEAKAAAKKGDTDIVRILAKEIVQSRKAVNRIHRAKAHLNSVTMTLDAQMAQYKIAGTMQKSKEMMTMMNKLVKVNEVSEVMQDMQKEMVKSGMMQEYINDALDAVGDEEDSEDADEEVEKIIEETTSAALKGSSAPTSSLPAKAKQAVAEEEESEDEELVNRLNALKTG